MPEFHLLPLSNPSSSSPGPPSNAPDISEQVKKAQEEMTQKIEEIVKSKTDLINSSVESIKEFDAKINKLEGAISNTKTSVGEFKDRLDKIDESLLELLSLYEVVSSTVNPFVGDKGMVPNEKLDQIEKRIDILSQKPSEIPANIKEEYDIKFKALEGSLEELTQLIGLSAGKSGRYDQERLGTGNGKDKTRHRTDKTNDRTTLAAGCHTNFFRYTWFRKNYSSGCSISG